MPVKRIRRSPPPSDQMANERLKRAKLAGNDFSNWGWVGNEVTDASQITQEHKLVACGLSKYSPYPLCPNKYVKPDGTIPKKEKVAAGELEDDIIVISDDESAYCNAKSCRNNPNCLNHIGQDKWEAEDKAFSAFMKNAALGENPLLSSRDPGTPIGLKNLGATCYANAFLQVWFQDLPFRHGVYSCLPAAEEEMTFEESPIFQLQVTFTAMQESIVDSFNPVKLVESLKLRSTEQQDAQEFSKLFMAHLDTEFQKQSNPVLKSLLADQFQGKQVYGTECATCHTKSERDSEFMEIEVNLPRNSKLEDRISALLEAEELSGDNQYLCSRCDELRDAKRYTEFRQLPPVLHISLLRFVFDMNTLERKKSKHAITFPLTLDMGQFLSQNNRQSGQENSEYQPRDIYHLRGILLHKGPSAYHGHYEAQVYDVTSKSWYQFNDEIVTKIPSLVPKPKIETNSAKAKKPAMPRPKKRVRIEDSDVEILDGPPLSSQGSNGSSNSARVSSKDAYMLVYARSEGLEDSSSSENHSPIRDAVPPPRALEVVNALNAEHDKACDEYAAKEKEAREVFDQKRRMVMDIYRSWSLSSHDEDSGIVSRQALESWLLHRISKPPAAKHDATAENSDNPPIVNGTGANERTSKDCERSFQNDDIACPHGRLDPSKASSMKRVLQRALDRIADEDHARFIPVFKPSDVCQDCVEAIFQERMYQVEHPQDVARFEEVDHVEPEGRGYWISKAWLRGTAILSSEADPPPDDAEYIDDVICEHNGLVTNPSSRRRISAKAYDIIKSVFPSVELPPASREICAVCEAHAQITKEDKRGIRKQAEDEKAKLKTLYDYGVFGLPSMLAGPCAVVPERFIRSWRQWVLRPTEVERPEIMDNTRFLCQHGLLSFDPNVDGDIDGVSYVKRGDWDQLEKLYSGGPLIALESVGDNWIPELSICEECRKERKTTFESTEITIHILKPTDSVPSDATPPTVGTAEITQAAPVKAPGRTYGSRNQSGLRQSRRIRQAKKQERQCRVTISRSTTVKELKMEVHNKLDIPTICQRLYFRGQEVEDNATNVVMLGVMSNDVLYLKEEAEDVDMLDTDAEDPLPKSKSDEGGGFGGTLLSSSASVGKAEAKPTKPLVRSCSACTFNNLPDAGVCEICSTRL